MCLRISISCTDVSLLCFILINMHDQLTFKSNREYSEKVKAAGTVSDKTLFSVNELS